MYPSMQVHFPSKQLAYGDSAHCSLKVQDWFKARGSIQTINYFYSKCFEKFLNCNIYKS